VELLLYDKACDTNADGDASRSESREHGRGAQKLGVVHHDLLVGGRVQEEVAADAMDSCEAKRGSVTGE
jgi:hypothetical protein